MGRCLRAEPLLWIIIRAISRELFCFFISVTHFCTLAAFIATIPETCMLLCHISSALDISCVAAERPSAAGRKQG